MKKAIKEIDQVKLYEERRKKNFYDQTRAGIRADAQTNKKLAEGGAKDVCLMSEGQYSNPVDIILYIENHQCMLSSHFCLAQNISLILSSLHKKVSLQYGLIFAIVLFI